MRRFFSITLLGGATVVLPVVVFLLILQWLIGFLADITSPVTELVTDNTPLNDFLTVIIALAVLLAICFATGLFIRTGVGDWFSEMVHRSLTRFAPGYKTIRELFVQMLGGSSENNLLKGEPVIARIFGADCPVSVTAIVTSRHASGWMTVFVPTAPFPTSGVTYHLPPECIDRLPGVTVEEAMRTIVSCGAGSAALLSEATKKTDIEPAEK
ncbi:MAG: DUF502 domain-containing protein [bacterium]